MEGERKETKGEFALSANRIDLFALSERTMGMSEDDWQRHANPQSVYSRISILPLMTVAILSRVWLGWWALLPVGICVAWTWWNPRAFGPPATLDSWAARGVLGERLFLNRHNRPVPAHHARWAKVLAAVSALGIPPWIYGLWQIDAGMILFGLCLLMGGKLWFLDRMVWLHQDMRQTDAE